MRRSCENQQHLADSLRLRRFAWRALRRSDAAKTAVISSLRGLKFTLTGPEIRIEGFFIRVFIFCCVYPGRQQWLRQQRPRASFHPPRRLPPCSTSGGGGKSSPDVTSNKGKATGIEGGIRPIFGLTLRDTASSWHLSIFLLFCSLAEGSLVTSRLKGPFYFSFFLRLNSCLLPKKRKKESFCRTLGLPKNVK